MGMGRSGEEDDGFSQSEKVYLEWLKNRGYPSQL